MTKKRYQVIDNNFSVHIEDTKYTEDKHEHNLYDVWEMCRKLNELSEENEQLKKENIKLKEDLEHCANQFTNDGKNVLLNLR